MNIEQAGTKIEKYLKQGKSKYRCYDLCKIWDIDLSHTVIGDNLETAKLLLEAGADVNYKPGDTVISPALYAASYYGRNDFLKLFLDYDVIVQDQNSYALHTAIKRKHVETSEILIAAGCILLGGESRR